MAFADFTVTDFGAQWLAQAVEDAAQEMRTVFVDRIVFGLGNASSMTDVWKTCSTSIRIASANNSVTISGIVGNEGDTASHSLNRIEVFGHIGDDGNASLIAWALSETTEAIPPASEQLITRRAVVQIALGGEAAVSIAGAMSGYAAEDDVLLTAPHHTRGAIILSDAADSAYVTLSAVTDGAPEDADLRIGNGIRVASKATIGGKLYADGADAMSAPAGYSAIGGDLLVAGDIDASNGEVKADSATIGGLLAGGITVGRPGSTGNVYAGGSVMGKNLPISAVLDADGTYTCIDASGEVYTGETATDVWDTAGFSDPNFSGVAIIFGSDGVSYRRITEGQGVAPPMTGVFAILGFRTY